MFNRHAWLLGILVWAVLYAAVFATHR